MRRGKRQRWFAALALLIGAVILLACPASSGAKQNASAGRAAAQAAFFGTTVAEPPSVEEYQRMALGGIREVRLMFFPGAVEPRPGQRSWALYDKLVGDAARGGLRMDPLLYGVPSWMNPIVSTLPIQNQAQARYWSAFVREAAVRYGRGGRFWAQHPEIPPHPIHDWEVWNEPNINEFAGNKPVKAGQYAKLLRITGRALRGAGPGNRVLVGGLYRRPKPGHGFSMTRFLERLYKLPRGRSLFDGVAIHPYAAQPTQILRVTNRARRVMDANGDARTPIFITELGWTTGGNYWGQSLYRTTLAQQAARVRNTAELLAAHRGKLRLRRVIWHTWRDLAGSDDFWDKFMGFFTSDGHPKPAWTAFTQVTGGFAGGPLHSFGHQPLPPGPPPPPGGAGPSQPAPPPPPNQGCLLFIC